MSTYEVSIPYSLANSANFRFKQASPMVGLVGGDLQKEFESSLDGCSTHSQAHRALSRTGRHSEGRSRRLDLQAKSRRAERAGYKSLGTRRRSTRSRFEPMAPSRRRLRDAPLRFRGFRTRMRTPRNERIATFLQHRGAAIA